MRLGGSLELSPADIFGVALTIFSGRVYPITVMSCGYPSPFHDDRKPVVPFAGKFLFPVLIVSCHPERVMAEAVAPVYGHLKQGVGVRRNRAPAVLVHVGKQPVIVHDKWHFRECF